jgi:NTP pyrophosphatase (non-canonical NTP hydrolase)
VLVSYLEGSDFSRDRCHIIYGNKENTMSDFDKYQTAVVDTADYDDPFYPIASLMVEAAELADLFVKPLLRGDEGEPDVKEIVSEAGDVLWNLTAILSDYGISLHEVAAFNSEKLRSRKDRGVIRGKGGNR